MESELLHHPVHRIRRPYRGHATIASGSSN